MICEIAFLKCICIATVPLSMTIAFRITDTSVMDVVHLNVTACGYSWDWSFLKAEVQTTYKSRVQVDSGISINFNNIFLWVNIFSCSEKNFKYLV